jgi:hypothetical protein
VDGEKAHEKQHPANHMARRLPCQPDGWAKEPPSLIQAGVAYLWLGGSGDR